MGKGINRRNKWVEQNNGSWKQIKNVRNSNNDSLYLILKIVALLILLGVVVVLVLDWYGILKLGIFPKQEEKENGNGNN